MITPSSYPCWGDAADLQFQLCTLIGTVRSWPMRVMKWLLPPLPQPPCPPTGSSIILHFCVALKGRDYNLKLGLISMSQFFPYIILAQWVQVRVPLAQHWSLLTAEYSENIILSFAGIILKNKMQNTCTLRTNTILANGFHRRLKAFAWVL